MRGFQLLCARADSLCVDFSFYARGRIRYAWISAFMRAASFGLRGWQDFMRAAASLV
ncbi:hypothetical protein [Sporosarcina sp. Te-1]|uniref:hypothetical protein n=1 Tax=Sporosarcina sp. Te-1 TaxID=2818390 RepID=UPI001A9D7B40|nr:hypothetical protein [Sporosarcina sp. Te-1]QTD40791.1 hypothetical protein J3U78_18885 [Sporosarcina sp. Te-1]